jgi:ABC-type glycerol-3-phosphate transport system permease component
MRLFRLKKSKPTSKIAGNLFIYIVLTLVGIFMVLPLVYAVNNAFKPLDELFIFPPRFLVRNPTLENFKNLFIVMSTSWVPFSRYVFNTVFITAVGTIGHIILSSLAAYVLAKHEFPGSKMFFRIVVLSLMFAGQVTAIPNYLIMSKLGWLDTYKSIIVPVFALPLGLYLMKQFMEVIPDSVLESARIEGANEFIVYWRIAMPMVKPAWLTLIIFCIQRLWNIEGGNFIYSEQLKTLPYAIHQIITGGIARAGVGAAVTVLMMLVPILTFIITQSNIIQTMATSGMKE